MRLIDADKIGLTDFEILMCNGNYKEGLEMILQKIEDAPTIDAVPVVRCADCKWFQCNMSAVIGAVGAIRQIFAHTANERTVTEMDKDALTIQWMDQIIEAINAFRLSGVPDDVIVKRIYHLCRFERQQAQSNIDAALDALEERMKADGTI